MLSRLRSVSWTLGLAAVMLLANWSLFCRSSALPGKLTALLEYDREAILHGELWRLVTGNLVHWSAEHFVLDVGAFIVLGLLYEPPFKRARMAFGSFLLFDALAIGAAMFALLPDMNVYRGLSGVDSGAFAAALFVEAAQARRDPRRWFFLAPAIAVFVAKIGFECWTGELFFGTSSLGDLGQPVPLSHATGAVAALLYAVSVVILTRSQVLIRYGRSRRCLT